MSGISDHGYSSKKSLTEEPDDVSGKGLTKAKVLVVHRTGFVRVRSALVNCEKHAIYGVRRNGRSAFGAGIVPASQTAFGCDWVEAFRC